MSFVVELLPRGLRFTVEADETVLAAAVRQGYTFPHSCSNGVCGVCKGRLVSGRVHYQGVGLYGLTEDEIASGHALFCTARPETDLQIEVEDVLAPGEFPIKTIVCQIAMLEPVSADTWRVRLRPPVFDRPRFRAGQYLFLLGPQGERRAFSIASAPEDSEYVELHIRATPGHDAALAVIEQLRSGPVARIEIAHGQCTVRPGERPLLFIAGGTGFAPFKAMLESMQARGETRPVHLYWGARSLDHLYLRELPLRWARDVPNFRYTEVLSEPDPAWSGRQGLVHEAALADHPDVSGLDVYASGRPEMVFAAYDAFKARGLPADRFYSDMLDLRAAI